MTPEARLTRALELIYRVDNQEDLQELEEAIRHRRIALQQDRDQTDQLDEEWGDVAAPV